jgi:predicted Holliday junction resolvase-like endonuclease
VINVTNKYLIIIIVLLLSLAGTVTRIVYLQGKLYEAEMARTQIEQERIKVERERDDMTQKMHEMVFAPVQEAKPDIPVGSMVDIYLKEIK